MSPTNFPATPFTPSTSVTSPRQFGATDNSDVKMLKTDLEVTQKALIAAREGQRKSEETLKIAQIAHEDEKRRLEEQVFRADQQLQRYVTKHYGQTRTNFPFLSFLSFRYDAEIHRADERDRRREEEHAILLQEIRSVIQYLNQHPYNDFARDFAEKLNAIINPKPRRW